MVKQFFKSISFPLIGPIWNKLIFLSISNKHFVQNQFRNTKSKPSYYMAKQSPFSLYYREILDNCSEQSRTIGNQPDISDVINTNNMSKSIFQDEKSNKFFKKESKIKVFGLSDKRKSKEHIINEFSQSIDTNPKLQLIVQQNQQNLLESDRLAFKQKQEILDRTQKVENQQLNFSQLHKLLDLSSQIVLEINEQLKENVQHQIQNQIVSNESLKQAILPSEKVISFQKSKIQQQKYQTEEMHPNQAQCNLAKTESCLMNLNKNDKSNNADSKIYSKMADQLSEKVQYQISEVKRLNEQELTQKKVSNKSIFQQQTNQKPKSLNQIQSQKPFSKPKFVIPTFTNQITESKTFNNNVRVFQSRKYFTKEVPSKKLNEITQFELSQKQQTNKSKSQVPVMRSARQQKSVNLANFFNQYGNYSLQIENLINRYEKVSKLKQKDKQLKKEISELDKMTYRSANINTRQYYFPHQYDQQNNFREECPLYYTNQLQTKHFRQSFEGTKHKHQKSSDDETFVDRCRSEGGIQHELNHNVANMQKIIKKFKQISKNISSKKEINELILIESKYRKQAQQQTIEKDHYFLDNQHQNYRSQHFGKSTKKIANKSNMTQTMPIMKTQVAHNNQNFEESGEEIMVYEQVPHTSKKLLNGQFYRMKNINKDTARTQKKCGNNKSMNNHLLSGESLANYQCKCQHQVLLNQINRLNKKITQIQQFKQAEIKQVRSEEPNDKKRSLKKISKKSLERQQEHYSQEEDTANISIPQQQHNKVEDFKKQIQSKRFYKYEQTNGQKQTKMHQSNQKKESLNCLYKRKQINFPVFYNFPSRKDCLSELVEIGQYMFRLLFKFVVNHQNLNIPQLSDKCIFKVKKYLDCIHYFTSNQLNYHLIYYFKGKIYFGQWQSQQAGGNGYKSGVGYYYHPKKYVYEGQFALNYKHGYGIANYFNGQFYEGHWIKGKKQGKGVQINCMGDIYKGYFKLGKKNGKGEQQLNNGDRYKGQFKNGKIDGIGIYYWTDGSRYRGQFKDGILEGKGTWRSKDNDIYQGEFKNNKKSGEGTYKWNNGVVLSGYFKEEQKNVRPNLKISENTQRVKRKSMKYKQRGDYGRNRVEEQY